jgi:hypothetical protein
MTLDEVLIALILPLSVTEGSVVTIVTGSLSAQGCLDWQLALFC